MSKKRRKKMGVRLEAFNNFVTSYLKEGDTFFSILAPKGEDELNVQFAGDEKLLSQGFKSILERACDFDNEDEKAMEIINAFFNAVSAVLEGDDSRKSVLLARVLKDVMENASKSLLKQMAQKMYGNDEEEDDYEDCEMCEHYEECLKEELADAKKRLHDVQRRHRNK